ncbi:MAG: hypothetical protein HKN20_13690 [Gemmatimonadetes bacterium]|nr:hypothetical protein [Gemmatimonadota bacterium]
MRYDLYFRSNWDSPEVHLVGARDLLRDRDTEDRVVAFLPATRQQTGSAVLRSIGGRRMLTRCVTWRAGDGEIRFAYDLWRKWEGPYPSLHREDAPANRHFKKTKRYLLSQDGVARIAKEDLPKFATEELEAHPDADQVIVGFEEKERLCEMLCNPRKDRTLVREMQRDDTGFITHTSVQSWKGPPA